MFVYLSKKIAIPNNTRINCIAWNKDQGYIAVGGDEGLVKVLKLDQPNATNVVPARPGAAAASNLCMNQTLEGHKASVNVVCWNDTQQKLTTSDRDGVIMVWMLYKDSWYEEMTNDRKKSTVKGMAWTTDGQKICIVYEDGAIIVGSVDGNRIWGKELKNTSLTGVQWNPDGRLLLFSLRNGEVHLYDNQGTFVMKLNIQCVALGPTRSISVIGLSWFGGAAAAGTPISGRPALVVCYETGKLQIMRNENDDLPIIVDTSMQAVDCLWNHDGTILAVCGIQTYGNDKDSNFVKFYTAFGILLRTLKIPGREITALAWEGRSLRIALAVDSFIYFANIRPDYMWCFFGKTIAYLNAETNRGSSVITFWDTVSNQCNHKYVDTPIAIAASNDHCVIAIECSTVTSRDPNVVIETNSRDKKYQLLICNSISTTVDSKYIDLPLKFVAMNSQYVVAASRDHFLLWHYHTPKGASTLHNVKGRKDKRYHIDDTPSGVVEVINDLDKAGGFELPPNTHATVDPICCVAVSETILLVGRESGSIHEYSVPNVALRNRHSLSNRPNKMAINCNSSRATIIDSSGLLTAIDLLDSHELASDAMRLNQIERKDVWAMAWAKDNPQLLAIMEKTRMYVLRGADPEEPISCSGYICNFEDLEITGILLDEIISGAAAPDKSYILQLRVKSLRDTEELLSHVGIAETKQFISDNPHPRLWRLLAEAALKTLDLETAENAFVRCMNYPGIQLIKRLRTIPNEMLQKAEVAAFLGNFDEAEKLYVEQADRRDLAINLRQTLCDWFRTVQLYRMGPGISDQQMEMAWKEIGNHFARLRTWESAREYYEKAHDIDGLMESLYHLENFDELESCINKLPEKSPLLAKLGQMLASVGMCDQAVTAFIKQGDVKSAVNTCVNLKQWGQAVDLAQKYKMPQISALLGQHAAQLLQDGRLFEAIELKRKAGRFMDAARLMTKLAEGEVAKKTDMLCIKKLYVLAGLLIEDHLRVQASLTGDTRATIIASLMPEDAVLLQQIWHAAKAYHFMLMAQRQLRSGLIHGAVLTSLRLRDYEDVIDVEDIYCLMALTSCADRSFGTCSKAFIKLESLEAIPEQRRLEYEELAVNIFSQHDPHDMRIDRVDCYICDAMIPTSCASCSNCGTNFQPCIASGKSLNRPMETWQCDTCYHSAGQEEMVQRKSCPLCFSATKLGKRIEL